VRIWWVLKKPTYVRKALSALREDEIFRALVSNYIQPLLEELIVSSLDIFADLWHKRLTLKTLLQAKKALGYFCRREEVDYIRRAVDAMPEDEVTLLGGREAAIMALELGLLGFLLKWSSILADVPAFIRDSGLTEEALILRFGPPLSPENLAKYRAGRLTVGELFMTQPMVIIRNTD